jgi:predicted SAM-dependent methyltransferase
MNIAPKTKTAYLNVGCGGRFHKGVPWVNLDVAPDDASVLTWDARAGIPVEMNTFDVVYLSHVLEHFSNKDGARLVGECHRVLKAGGTLRVVVPDLEGICREYLRNLNEIRSTPPGHPDRLSWIKLELLDQCTRHDSGGGMRTFFCDHGLSELDYVVGRIGTVGLQLAKVSASPAADEKNGHPSHIRLKKWNWDSLRSSLLSALLSREESEALRTGKFRMQGEPHLWMYESVTLEQLLKENGFSAVEFHRADTSRIPDWTSYHLDRNPDGREHAPSSLYAEGTKCVQ